MMNITLFALWLPKEVLLFYAYYRWNIKQTCCFCSVAVYWVNHIYMCVCVCVIGIDFFAHHTLVHTHKRMHANYARYSSRICHTSYVIPSFGWCKLFHFYYPYCCEWLSKLFDSVLFHIKCLFFVVVIILWTELETKLR